MTLTEKLLARAAGKASVQAGDNVWVKADVLMTHDVCGPGTIGVFKRERCELGNSFNRLIHQSLSKQLLPSLREQFVLVFRRVQFDVLVPVTFGLGVLLKLVKGQ